jgi:hypothetical protein
MHPNEKISAENENLKKRKKKKNTNKFKKLMK